MLESVQIQRFKSVNDATVELGRVTLLVGPNNAGKSSVLQALQFAVSVAQSLKLDGTARWEGDRKSGTLSTQQLVYTPLRDVQALASGGALRQDIATAIRVSFSSTSGPAGSVRVSRGKNKNISVMLTGRALGAELEDLDKPFSVVAPGLAGIPSVEEFKSEGLVRRAAARGDANSVFRNVLWALKKDPHAWSEFHDALKEVFDDISVDVQFDERTDEHILATVTRKGVTLPVDSSGTGVLQAIQVLSYIGLYRPALLILDEPDSHLHPDNQRKLARLLDRVAGQKNIQILISTHSRHFLDEFGSLGATISWFSAGAIRAGTFDRVKALLELGALDAGDRLRNGATPLIVITEDSDQSYLRAILESSGIGKAKYDIWSYAGSSKLDAAGVLARFIADHAPGTKVLVHRDRDYMTDPEVDAFETAIKIDGAIPFITKGTDIEGYFLEPEHVVEVFPELDFAKAQELIEKSTLQTRDFSVEKLTNYRSEVAFRTRPGARQPNAGQIAREAVAEYGADPARFRHGKRTLSAFNALIQDELGFQRSLARKSGAIENNSLKRIGNTL